MTTLSIVWNPSEGIDLGFFMIRFYSLMFVIAFALGWFIMKKIYEREGESLEKLDTLFIWTVLATLVGARLGHVFFYDWPYYSQHLSEILLPFRFDPEFEFTGFQGLASHGAAIAIILTMILYSRKVIHRPVLWILDRVVLPVTCGGIFVRLGNFFNSEILGHETNSAFGIKFVRDTYNHRDAMRLTGKPDANSAYDAIVHDPNFANLLANVPAKHPTQLYEAAGYVVVFAILMYLYWKTDARLKTGFIFGVFLILLWTVRFVVEFVKESQGGIEKDLGSMLSTGQWLSIPFILAGIVLVFMAEKPMREKI